MFEGEICVEDLTLIRQPTRKDAVKSRSGSGELNNQAESLEDELTAQHGICVDQSATDDREQPLRHIAISDNE